MKIRSDFVSNSSSSSFILYNWGGFEYFKITKQDFVNAFTDIIGKKHIDEYRDNCKKFISSEDGQIGPFYIYDMFNVKDRFEAVNRWGSLLEQWNSRLVTIDEKGKFCRQYAINDYENAIESLNRIYGIFTDSIQTKNPQMWIVSNKKENNGLYGHYEPVPDHVIKVYKEIREKCRIKTCKEILDHISSRFFFHFDDNELWNGEITKPSYNEDIKSIRLKYNLSESAIRKYKSEIKKSSYSSESCSKGRIAETLFRYFIKNDIIDPTDKVFLDRVYKIPGQNGNPRYDTYDGITLGYRDLEENILVFNDHEG